MKYFYKRLKIFCVIVCCFLFVTLIPAIIYNVIYHNYGLVVLSLFALAWFSVLGFALLHYYSNIVIDISFEGSNTVITTNKMVYTLPSKYFTEVYDSELQGKVFITYYDGDTVKKFTFQKRYSMFKTYYLNIDEMKEHMTSAVFK